MIKLIQTCSGCPEQYDAFDENENQVGYLRLRHGRFTVQCPNVGDTLVYFAYPDGDGCFDNELEKKYQLSFAVYAIENWIRADKPKWTEAPDVHYEIQY